MIQLYLVFIMTNIILRSDAALTLTAVNPYGNTTINGLNVQNDFECNSEVTLICEIKPYENSAILQVDGVTYGLCTFGDCFTYPPFPENHSVHMNLTTEIFKIVVNPVPVSSNRSIYKCDDGKAARSLEAILKVYSNNESLEMDTTNDDQITVTTGCVYPNGIEDLHFAWFITKKKSILEKLLSIQNESTTIFDCEKTTSRCEVEGTAHFNNTVLFEVFEENGDDYYICVKITHENAHDRPPAVRCSDRTYKIKKKVGHFCMCDCYELLIVAGCAELIHIVLGVLLFVTWKGRDYSTKDKYFASAFEYLIVLCDLLWIVMFVLYIWSLIICFEGDCICSKIVRVAGVILLSLFGIHIILGCILLYVLYYRNRTVVNDDDKCSTSNATFIRSICSTIPVAGLFAVCQWLISVYRSEKPAKHNKKRDPIDKGKTEQKSTKGSEALPDISPKKSGRTFSKSAQRRENKKIDKHFSTERSDLSRQSKGESDKVSTSSVILKKKANVKNEFSKSNEPSTTVESARNNVPPNSTVDHNEKGTRSENRSHNGGSVTNSSSKKKKKTSRAKLERSTVDKTSREDPGKPLSTEEQTSTSHGNVKHVNALDLKKKSDGSPSPSTEKSSYPSTSHISSQNSTKEAQIKSHSAEEHASTSHENVKHVTVLDTKEKSDGRPRQSTEKSSNPSTSHINSTNNPNGDRIKSHSGEKHTNTSHENVKHVTVLESKKKSDGRPSPSTEKSSNPSTSHNTSTNSPNGDRIKSHSGEKHTKSETMKRALSANFKDDEDDTTEVSDDHFKTLNRENTPL